MSEQRILMCAPATAALTTRGSDMSRFCFRCKVRVMIAPSGQRLVRDNPEVRIACTPCGFAHAIESGEPITLDLAAPVEEILGEIMAQRQNSQRYRN